MSVSSMPLSKNGIWLEDDEDDMVCGRRRLWRRGDVEERRRSAGFNGGRKACIRDEMAEDNKMLRGPR